MKGFMQRLAVPGAVSVALLWTAGVGGMTALSGNVEASSEPYVFPQETRLVRFRYDANRTYEILARPDAPTNIALHPDEELVALAIGDTVQWLTDDVPGHIFVKPIRSGIYTAGTIVTTERTYQISLRAVPESGQWYQRVSWEHGSGDMVREARRQSGEAKTSAQRRVAEDLERFREGGAGATDRTRSPRPEDLNFGYEIRGAEGIVQNVFDDGRALWIRLEDGLEELPAVFVEGRASSEALANYRVQGQYIVVHQVSRVTKLRIGRDEVVIEKG